jgi:hypothetical protein
MLANTAGSVQNVMIVGHNPTAASLVQALATDGLSAMGTATAVLLELRPAPLSWREGMHARHQWKIAERIVAKGAAGWSQSPGSRGAGDHGLRTPSQSGPDDAPSHVQLPA